MSEQRDIKKLSKERFKKLPKSVQDAITSAEVEEHLRGLAKEHKLHLDQWQKLENEVVMTLLGFQEADELEGNIRKRVVVSDETARSLASAIAKGVFAPIRTELGRILDEPRNKANGAQPQQDVAKTQNEKKKVQRAPISATYKPQQPSAERAEIDGDPYREPVE